MTCPFYLVDAFAHSPLSGNPAGVCVLEEPACDEWMQHVGGEVNQAETAFVWPIEGGWSLRWFTPTVEVDLCGHATLAAASVIDANEARFSTRSGWLSARKVGGQIFMDFPGEPVVEAATPFNLPGTVWQGANRMDWFVVLESEDAVRGFNPNMHQIAEAGLRGLCITAKSEVAGVDFISRFFAPQSGVPEDAVTGSAHCGLVGLWHTRLALTSMVGYQASARGGYVGVQLIGDRVELSGTAHRIIEGTLTA